MPDRSPESRELSLYYTRLQDDLVARGLLRTDGGGPDTPFTDTQLARNFIRIPLLNEYLERDGVLTPQPNARDLSRWDQPVRIGVEFGATVPADQRVQDENSIRQFSARLSRLTGLPITVGAPDPNFHVLVLNEDDRLGYSSRLRDLVPGIDAVSLDAFMSVPRDTLCLVIAFSEGGRPDYSRAVALVRGEHPDLMRLACIHEEMAQGLGLANDSPRARPSIFNDDEEFALLTTHDEMLLRMLYDDRLRSGMGAAEAAPIARQIARELLGGES